MNRLIFFIAALLSVLVGCQSAPQSMPGLATLRIVVAAEPKTGVITGNTHVLSYDAPVATTAGSGQFDKVDYSSLDDIVVWLEPVDGPSTKPTRTSAIALSIDAAKPAAAISVASVGQVIKFHNSGGASINLYSVSDGNDFDLGSVRAGGNGVYVVKAPGLIEVLTDSIREPVAKIYAASSEWARMTHAKDTIEFNDLPPGRYRIVSWHPRLPGQTLTTTVSANQVTNASIKVGVNDLPKVDAN